MCKALTILAFLITIAFPISAAEKEKLETELLKRLQGTWVVTKTKNNDSTAKSGKINFTGATATIYIVWHDDTISEFSAFISEIDKEKIYVGEKSTGEKGLLYKLDGNRLNIEWMLRKKGARLGDVVLERNSKGAGRK